jgi:ankyrin repeat protein
MLDSQKEVIIINLAKLIINELSISVKRKGLGGIAMDIFEQITKADHAAVRQAISENPQVVYVVNQAGIRPLMVAVYYGNQELAAYLRQNMASINLWEAAALGELATVQQLITQEPGMLNAYSEDGYPALGLAAFFGQPEVVEWLLEQGANPNLPAKNAMEVCPIHSAAANRDHEISLRIVRLLVAHGARVNIVQPGGWTPLHQAADHGNVGLVEFLLSAGANRSLKSADGRTPADMAAEKGFEKLAELLR